MFEKKKNRRLSMFIRTLLIIASLLLGALAFAIQQRSELSDKAKSRELEEEDKIEYDESLLIKFRALTSKMSMLRSYYCKGTIAVLDEADSVNTMRNVPFEICMTDKQFYYKLGNTETISKAGITLSIDRPTRRILLSTAKAVAAPDAASRIMDISKFADAFESEHYLLKRALSGPIETLSLLNPRHITCKEYSVSVDTITGMPVRFYTKLTNLDDPLRTDNERVVDIRISRWDDASLIEKYTDINVRVLKNRNGWIATEAYKDYEVVEVD